MYVAWYEQYVLVQEDVGTWTIFYQAIPMFDRHTDWYWGVPIDTAIDFDCYRGVQVMEGGGIFKLLRCTVGMP